MSDHLDVVGASPVGAASFSTSIFILHFTPGFNRMHKDSPKTRREAYKFGDLLRLILDIWRYILCLQITYYGVYSI